MSNTREKLISVIRDHPDETVKLADAIIAALPGLVKPLEWRELDEREFGNATIADSLAGLYEAGVDEAGQAYWRFHMDVMRPMIDVKGWLHDAQAAAQAHYVAQIMKAFGIGEDNQ